MAFGVNPENNIEITVSVDANGAIRAFDELGKQMSVVETKAKSGESAWTTYNQALQAIIGTFKILKEGAGKALEFVERGSEVDDVAEAFDRLASAAGSTAKVLSNELNRATDNTISAFEIQRKAIEALRAGVKPDELIAMTRAARLLAEEGGKLSEEWEILSRAFETGQTRILRNKLGIIDLEKAQAEFAKTLGISSEELSVEGQLLANRQALLNAVNEKIKNSATLNQDAGDAINRLSAEWNNFVDTASVAIAKLDIIAYTLNLVSAGLRTASSLIDDVGAGFNVLSRVPLDNWVQLFSFTPNIGGFNLALQGAQLQYAAEMQNTTKATSELNKQTKELATSRNSLIKSTNASANAEKALAEEMKKLITLPSKAYHEFVVLNTHLARTKVLLDSNENTFEGFGTALVSIANDANSAALALVQMGESAEMALSQVAKASSEAININKPTSSSDFTDNILGSIFGIDFNATTDELEAQLTAELGNALTAGINNAIQIAFAGLSGQTVTGAQIVPAAGNLIGTGVGAGIGAIFGEIGAIIGAQIGAGLGQGIGQLVAALNKDSKGTAARKKIDEYFAELFEAQRLSIIVSGQLQQMWDLVFSGNSIFGGAVDIGGGPANAYLATLTQPIQDAFNAVGIAFENLQEVGVEFEGYLAGALANNLGNLNNLQLALQATGASAEELNNALMEAFLQGRMSAEDFMKEMLALQNILKRGIPDAIGAMDQAFSNVFAAGWDGGRALLDALADVGAEAQELGLTTLPQMADILINKFGFAAQQVSIFMQAMAQAGIKSVADLANASNEVLSALAANMQSLSQGGAGGYVPIPTPSVSSAGGGGGGGGSRSSSAADAKKRAQTQFRTDVMNAVTGSALYSAWLSSSGSDSELKGIYKDISAAMKEVNTLTEKAEKQMQKYGYVTAKTAKELENAKNKLNELTKASQEQEQTQLTVNDALFNFALKFKDSIELVNIAAQAAGVTFKDMQKSAIEAFLAGKTSATEALTALQDLDPGVAGKQGAVSEAFSNFLKYGTKGGRLTVDALKGIGGEAKELAAKSIDDLLQLFKNQGISDELGNKFFLELANNGITTMDQLLNLSDETAIKIIAHLNEMQFPFEQTSSEITTLLDDIAKIPSSKDLVINVTAQMDEATIAILNKLGIDTSAYGKAGDAPGINANAAADNTSATSSLSARQQSRLDYLKKRGKKGRSGTFGS